MTTTQRFIMLAAATTFAAASAQAAIINIADYSFAPDGQNLTTTFQHTDINALNGGQVLPTGTPKTVYVVSTFTFGTGSSAHLQWAFSTSSTVANRIGIEIQDNGLVQTINTGNGQLNGDGTPKRTTVNLTTPLTNGFMGGQTVTLLAKLQYDATFSDTYQATSNGVTPTTADDTLMNLWINPTGTSVEGSGLSAGDMYALWNSAGFSYFRQNIQNQFTPGTAGTSSITNTTILTGTDATWANALALATIPEPSAALLGGLGLLALLRRRRN